MHHIVSLVAKAFFLLRRILRLTSTHSLMRSLKRRGVKLKSLRALELFGGRGDMTTKDYAPYVGSLEIWEIDPDCEAVLRKAFPQATIKITDSYVEIKRTSQKFDLVIADAWIRVFGNYCEHFDLFPDIFRILSQSSILILNVLPEIRRLSPEHAQRRRAFYQVEDPTKIPLEVMAKRYSRRMWVSNPVVVLQRSLFPVSSTTQMAEKAIGIPCIKTEGCYRISSRYRVLATWINSQFGLEER